jgi:NAD-dependent SIR2 family protein deacetylase
MEIPFELEIMLEKAADEHYNSCLGMVSDYHSFIEGARWVLDKLSSKEYSKMKMLAQLEDIKKEIITWNKDNLDD